MFAKLTTFATVAVVASSAFANPIDLTGIDLAAIADTNLDGFSFNQFNDLGNFGNFDNFFGVNNFLGLQNEVNVLAQVQCLANSNVNLVQQQLSILAELAKQVVLTELCDPADQIIALEQFQGQIDSFSSALRGVSNLSLSFDNSIAQLGAQLFVDGQLNQNDFGFVGSQIGQNAFLVVNNLNNDLGALSLAYELAHEARIQSLDSAINQVELELGNDEFSNNGLNAAEIAALGLNNIGNLENSNNSIDLSNID